MTTKIKPIVLSSGITVMIPKIAVSSLMLDLVRAYPKPQPPTQVVVVGGRETIETNYAHPGYEKAVRAWEEDLQTSKASELILRMVADVNTLTDSDKELVQSKRDLLGDLVGNQSDKMIWLRYVAIESDDDLKTLMQAVRSSGEPSPEGVAAVADGFRGNS